MELLRLPALVYAAAAGLRGRLYDRGLLPVARLDVPVVCLGNLSAGGTGKTPAVVWVARRLADRGLTPGILSRGYGGGGGEGDEVRLLNELLGDVPLEQDPDRVAGGRRLVQRGVDAIVMDDGFQHRRLHRDLDLVLVDASRPWGLPATDEGQEPVRAHLPRGLLREGPAALGRAHAILITRSDQVSAETLQRLEARLEDDAPGCPQCRAEHRPVGLRSPASAGSERLLPSALRGREVDLVSGIGNPDAFEATVRGLGATVVEHRRFADHHPFRPGDLEGLGRGRWTVTTAKDAARLGEVGDLYVLDVELALTSGAPVLEALLDALPAGRARRERASLHEGLHG